MARRKSREVPMISLERLSLDDANPRFSESLSQTEMLAIFAADEKTANLAKHMARFGIDPTSNLAVMQGQTATRFVVREGKPAMPLVRIFVMYPAGNGKSWHVSEEGREGETYTDGLEAIQAACDRARVLEDMGHDVQVRQEGADGSWQVIRE